MTDHPISLAILADKLDDLDKRVTSQANMTAQRMRTAQSDLNYRRQAMDILVAGGAFSGQPTRDVERAAAIERYLRNGAPAQPEAAANPLPRPFMERAQRAPAVLLDVLSAIMAERERQIAKGRDAASDDKYEPDEMAYMASLAINPEDDGNAGWIDNSQPRPIVLLQGVALAVAEMERYNRAYNAQNRDFINNVQPAPDVTAAATNVEPPEGTAHPGPGEADRNMTPGDYDNIAHALGRPTHPLNQTYRNRFVDDTDSLAAQRFAMFPDIWGSQPFGGAKGMTLFYVRDAGRHALADFMARCPDAIRDTKDNSKEPAYVAEPVEGPDSEPKLDYPDMPAADAKAADEGPATEAAGDDTTGG